MSELIYKPKGRLVTGYACWFPSTQGGTNFFEEAALSTKNKYLNTSDTLFDSPDLGLVVKKEGYGASKVYLVSVQASLLANSTRVNVPANGDYMKLGLKFGMMHPAIAAPSAANTPGIGWNKLRNANCMVYRGTDAQPILSYDPELLYGGKKSIGSQENLLQHETVGTYALYACITNLDVGVTSINTPSTKKIMMIEVVLDIVDGEPL